MKRIIKTAFLISILCFCIASCSNNQKKPEVPSVPAPVQQPKPEPEPEVDKGKILFEEKCITCHGADGTAGIANAANLQTSTLDSISIIQTITNGRNSKMPTFKDKLSTSEIEKISIYVRSLRK